MAGRGLLRALLLCLVSFVVCELPEENLDVPGLIRYWGYPVEIYEAQTEDGYVLTLHRIPYGTLHELKTDPRPVVFLQHGLLCSSSNWVTNLPSQSLAFMLADAGFDVWLGNVRGNTYSTKHTKYDPNSDDGIYWDFSWDQMAKFDLPAMVDKALNVSGSSGLYYVGHSQGTMIAFAGLSENEDLRKKILTVFALAPVARLASTESPIRYLSYVTNEIRLMFKALGVRDFLPSTSWMKFIAEKVCPEDELVCSNALFLLAGYDKANLNETRIPVYMAHTPAGTSVKNVIHFAQLISSKRFQAYDYGMVDNLRRYGTVTPKVYDLSKISTRVAAYSGSQDWLADPDDVSWLLKRLPHVVVDKQLLGYNHLDFIWGEDARSRVYKDIINLIRKYYKADVSGVPVTETNESTQP